MALLNAFFKDFRGPSVGVPDPKTQTSDQMLVANLADSIELVENDIIGDTGVQALYLSTANTLAEMQAAGVNEAQVLALATTFCTKVQVFFESTPCVSAPGTRTPPATTLKVITGLTEHLEALRVARQAVPWKSDRTQAETDIIKRADALLGQVDQLLTAAQNARIFALRVGSARGHFDEQTTVTLEKGRKLTINITPTSSTALQRAADRQPLTRSVMVRPD